MPCCYSDISVAVFSEKTMDHPFKSLISKRSFGDGTASWIHSDEYIYNYLEYLSTTDASGKIRFTM